ncbi:MAG: leucine-rich repeat domain-containing protein [Clostridia bacterium]|nr:leucine-rich repeat domain-containing protein [Clostridia bacterium]
MIKMNLMKKLGFVAILALLLSLVICLAAGAETVSGTEDDGLAWSLDTDSGVLTVSGTGKMKNYNVPGAAPWSAYSDSIKTLKVESGVASVGRWAFADCSALESVTLPEGLTAISYGAFEDCVALKTLVLPSTLKSINYGAFQNCKSLVSVELPAGLTALEGKAFAGCEKLESVNLPKGITELKWGVFEGCKALKNVPIHDGVKNVDSYAFKDCESVRNVTLPMTLKSIGVKAFEKCVSLVKLVISSLKTWIGGDATTIPDSTTIYAEPNSGASQYVDTYDKTAVIACTHQSVIENVIKAPTCTATGETLIECNNCEYSETVITAPTHSDVETPSVLGFVEAECTACGHKAMILGAGETLSLSAFCKGTLSFTVEANSTDEIELIVDGENRGLIDLSDGGVATVTLTELAEAGHTVDFVNYSESNVYVKNMAIDGVFHRYDTVYDEGAVYLEMLGKGDLDYSDFYAYVRTSDASGNYYIRYKFDYIYNDVADSYLPNTCTNIGSYRLNGATLVEITGVSADAITAREIYTVLGGGEVSLALRWLNPNWDILPESLNTPDYIFDTENSNKGTVIEHIGGFHGDEWMSKASLIADGTVIDLTTSEHTVLACSSLLFDLTTTMHAWGTSYKTETEYYRGLPFAEHGQSFVVNAGGIAHMQSVEFLIEDFKVTGYMPMFTMMRGSVNDRFIDTMRSYNDNGDLVDTFVMTPGEEIKSQTTVLADWAGTTVAAYEYDGPKGVSARIGFREANDNLHLAAYIAMRAESNGNSADNKMYAPITSETPALGEVWMVESHYVIDYDTEKIK